ncbi:unnamed protein product, partial [Onchocerca ochengi]|uniref:DNA-directed DNA polymerase n=1 Tax=Onchocerca ochengi TaxID=42157 RepID=A0A182EZF3_ONCOC
GKPIDIAISHASEVRHLMKQCFPDVKNRDISKTPPSNDNIGVE